MKEILDVHVPPAGGLGTGHKGLLILLTTHFTSNLVLH